jgi:hypothetical protein
MAAALSKLEHRTPWMTVDSTGKGLRDCAHLTRARSAVADDDPQDVVVLERAEPSIRTRLDAVL